MAKQIKKLKKSRRKEIFSDSLIGAGAGIILGGALGYVYKNLPLGLFSGAVLGLIAGLLKAQIVLKVCEKQSSVHLVA